MSTCPRWSTSPEIGAICCSRMEGWLAFIGGQSGMPRGLMYPNKLRFAPRLGLAHHFEKTGLVFRAAYGIFYTPVDMNTWCNQLHNAPIVFPFTQQSDNFTPGINGFNFPQPVLGQTVTSFSAFDPSSAVAVYSAVERVRAEEPRSRHHARDRLPRRTRPASAAVASDQQCRPRSRALFSRDVRSRSRRFFPGPSSRRASRSPARPCRSARSTCWRIPLAAGTTADTSTFGDAIRTG